MYKVKVDRPLSQVDRQLRTDLREVGGMKLLGESKVVHGATTVVTLVYERYYLRSQAKTALMIVLVGDEESAHVTAMSGGGETVKLFRFGTDQNIVQLVAASLNGEML